MPHITNLHRVSHKYLNPWLVGGQDRLLAAVSRFVSDIPEGAIWQQMIDLDNNAPELKKELEEINKSMDSIKNKIFYMDPHTFQEQEINLQLIKDILLEWTKKLGDPAVPLNVDRFGFNIYLGDKPIRNIHNQDQEKPLFSLMYNGNEVTLNYFQLLIIAYRRLILNVPGNADQKQQTAASVIAKIISNPVGICVGGQVSTIAEFYIDQVGGGANAQAREAQMLARLEMEKQEREKRWKILPTNADFLLHYLINFYSRNPVDGKIGVISTPQNNKFLQICWAIFEKYTQRDLNNINEASEAIQCIMTFTSPREHFGGEFMTDEGNINVARNSLEEYQVANNGGGDVPGLNAEQKAVLDQVFNQQHPFRALNPQENAVIKQLVVDKDQIIGYEPIDEDNALDIFQTLTASSGHYLKDQLIPATTADVLANYNDPDMPFFLRANQREIEVNRAALEAERVRLRNNLFEDQSALIFGRGKNYSQLFDEVFYPYDFINNPLGNRRLTEIFKSPLNLGFPEVKIDNKDIVRAHLTIDPEDLRYLQAMFPGITAQEIGFFKLLRAKKHEAEETTAFRDLGRLQEGESVEFFKILDDIKARQRVELARKPNETDREFMERRRKAASPDAEADRILKELYGIANDGIFKAAIGFIETYRLAQVRMDETIPLLLKGAVLKDVGTVADFQIMNANNKVIEIKRKSDMKVVKNIICDLLPDPTITEQQKRDLMRKVLEEQNLLNGWEGEFKYTIKFLEKRRELNGDTVVGIMEMVPRVPDKAMKMVGGNDYDFKPDIKSPKNFLLICWALMEEYYNSDQANCDDDIKKIFTQAGPNQHFGNINPAEARKILADYRKCLDDDGNPFALLHRKEVAKLEEWGVNKTIIAVPAIAAIPVVVVPQVAPVAAPVVQPQIPVVAQQPQVVLPPAALPAQIGDALAIASIDAIIVNVNQLVLNKKPGYFDDGLNGVNAIDLGMQINNVFNAISPLRVIHAMNAADHPHIDAIENNIQALKDWFENIQLLLGGGQHPEIMNIEMLLKQRLINLVIVPERNRLAQQAARRQQEENTARAEFGLLEQAIRTLIANQAYYNGLNVAGNIANMPINAVFNRIAQNIPAGQVAGQTVRDKVGILQALFVRYQQFGVAHQATLTGIQNTFKQNVVAIVAAERQRLAQEAARRQQEEDTTRAEFGLLEQAIRTLIANQAYYNGLNVAGNIANMPINDVFNRIAQNIPAEQVAGQTVRDKVGILQALFVRYQQFGQPHQQNLVNIQNAFKQSVVDIVAAERQRLARVAAQQVAPPPQEAAPAPQAVVIQNLVRLGGL